MSQLRTAQPATRLHSLQAQRTVTVAGQLTAERIIKLSRGRTRHASRGAWRPRSAASSRSIEPTRLAVSILQSLCHLGEARVGSRRAQHSMHLLSRGRHGKESEEGQEDEEGCSDEEGRQEDQQEKEVTARESLRDVSGRRRLTVLSRAIPSVRSSFVPADQHGFR